MERDFKGVWIPKEIWLNKELSMLEKVLFTEIDSLDNENHCIAGNEYFAEFCNCSVSAVTKAIKHLKELEYIEEVEFNGRIRKLRIVKNTNLHSKIYEAESENLRANNIYNNINNKKEILSKDRITGFDFGKKAETKPSLYNKCVALTDDFITNHKIIDNEVRKALIDYLMFRINIKDKPLYINIWKNVLKNLETIHVKGYDYLEIINYNLSRSYLNFYEPSNFNNKQRLSEPKRGTGCTKNTEAEEAKRTEFINNMRKQGKRIDF